MGHLGKKSRLDGTTCAKKASWGHLANILDAFAKSVYAILDT